MGGDIQGQVKLRMVLKLGHEADARKFLDDYNTTPVHLVSTNNHKQAVINTESGQDRANQIVDLLYLSDEALDQRLKALRSSYPIAGASTARNQPLLNTDEQSKAIEVNTSASQPYTYTPPEQRTSHPDFIDWDADPRFQAA
jgi:hypothetical protein